MNARPLLTTLLAIAALAAAPDPRPSTQPATDDLVALGNDVVRLHAPPSSKWALRPMAQANQNEIFFTADEGRAAIDIQLAPADYPLTASTVAQVTAAIVKSLKATRDQQGRQMVLPPTVEKDHRFEVVVHERYLLGDATVDSMHLLKLVGPRTVMVVASTASPDPTVVADTFNAAETALASAKVNKKSAAHKKP